VATLWSLPRLTARLSDYFFFSLLKPSGQFTLVTNGPSRYFSPMTPHRLLRISDFAASTQQSAK
jgi:hypothetical protein